MLRIKAKSGQKKFYSMRKTPFFIFFTLFLFLFLPYSFSQTILGVTPSFVEIEKIERGETKVLGFYVVSLTDEEILVSLSSKDGDIHFFIRKYGLEAANFSEESISDWIEFIENPVKLEASSPKLAELRNIAKGAREINFVLKVPEDAEPGWHMFKIRPIPVISTGAKEGVGTVMMTVVDVTYVFKVPGRAIRSGEIKKVYVGERDGNRLPIYIEFENDGTVSMNVKITDLKLEKDGKIVKRFSGPVALSKPQSIMNITTYLDVSDIPSGYYVLYANASYTTGGSDYFQIIYVPPPPVEQPIVSEERKINWWIIISIVLIILIIVLVVRKLREG